MALSCEARLQFARHLVAESEAIVSCQTELLKQLVRDGLDTAQAQEMLTISRAVLACRLEGLAYWQRRVEQEDGRQDAAPPFELQPKEGGPGARERGSGSARGG